MATQLIRRARPCWRAIVLVLVATVVGAPIVQPALARVDGESVTPAAATTKWASCSSFDFYPTNSANGWSNTGVIRHSYEYVGCGLTLPHGATVTAVKFHVFDEANADGVSVCYVSRAKLDPPTGAFQRLAGPMATSGAPGFAVLSDTSINNAVINNQRYAYWAECYIDDYAPTLGIVGVSVRYRPAG